MHLARILFMGTLSFVPAFVQAQSPPPEWKQMFNYDRSAPLDLKQREYSHQAFARVYDIDFASPKGGRVTGFLVLPTTKSPHPGVVFGHWGPGDRLEFLPEALLYAKAGIASVMIDYPWKRPQPWREPHFTAQTTNEHDRDTEIQAVVDLRRSIDVLLSQPGVDPARVAYVGHSFGAQFGAILSAVDKRMAASVLIAGTPSFRAIFIEGKSPEMVELQQQVGPPSLSKAEKTMTALDGIRYVPYAAPIRLFFQFAQYEQSFSREAMQAYFDAASKPKTLRWYPSGHELNDIHALVDRATFLAEHLKVPALTSIIRQEVDFHPTLK
jgi:cephalosporin-C deacetylase-like acetyl esterase